MVASIYFYLAPPQRGARGWLLGTINRQFLAELTWNTPDRGRWGPQPEDILLWKDFQTTLLPDPTYFRGRQQSLPLFQTRTPDKFKTRIYRGYQGIKSRSRNVMKRTRHHFACL